MTTISKRDAMALVDKIRRANVAGHAIAAQVNDISDAMVMACFLGALEAVLQDFLVRHGCVEAAEALPRAMNDMPPAADIAAYQKETFSTRTKATGGTQ